MTMDASVRKLCVFIIAVLLLLKQGTVDAFQHHIQAQRLLLPILQQANKQRQSTRRQINRDIAFTRHQSVETPALLYNHNDSEHDKIDIDHDSHFSQPQQKQQQITASSSNLTRRQALAIASVSLLSLQTPPPANAGLPEVDSTGQLYTPRPQMLKGGSDAARGLRQRDSESVLKLKPGQSLQTVYETRFIAYLCRFLLTFDPSLHAWWIKQGFGDTWEQYNNMGVSGTESKRVEKAQTVFASFAESVEVGLADYFVGPYGSYSSLAAAKAGLFASQPAPSIKADSLTGRNIFDMIFNGQKKVSDVNASVTEDSVRAARIGILNLYTLLKARYDSVAAKRQLAILFSFISNPRLQPAAEICSLLAEADNATVTRIDIMPSTASSGSSLSPTINESTSRTSSRRGGGYSVEDIPKVIIDAPPALGDTYMPTKAIPLMRPTSRILCIKLIDGGEGYTTAPNVVLSPPPIFNVIANSNNNNVLTGTRPCQAHATINRKGQVDSVFILDPGYGYGGKTGQVPTIQIDAPPSSGRNGSTRRAKAEAELEYEVYSIKIVQGGNGYVSTEPPKVTLTPPKTDPDWYLNLHEQPQMRLPPNDGPSFRLAVTQMTYPDGNIAYSIEGTPRRATVVDNFLLYRLQSDPLELLPSSFRPEQRIAPFFNRPYYVIPSIATLPQSVNKISPKYRATDPVFGSVGQVPVTKGASALSASEYARLALSGAVCTVLVRTALNPLELVKTKQQLQNDPELMEHARKRIRGESPDTVVGTEPLSSKSVPIASPQNMTPNKDGGVAVMEKVTTQVHQNTTISPDTTQVEETKPVKIGTMDVIKSMVELRGPVSLFQSADITFLASLVFGSAGFGATELFRRSFTLNLLGADNTSESGAEIVLLLAAAVATVITALFASPFEVLRVRSMGNIEAKSWTEVLQAYIANNKKKEQQKKGYNGRQNGSASSVAVQTPTGPLDWSTVKPMDLVPLFSGFAPIVSRELPFALAKFLAFDVISKAILLFINNQAGDGALPIQVGVGPAGLAVSAFAGAVAGIAGAFVSHPADLILTKTSAAQQNGDDKADWRDIVGEIVNKPGGPANLLVGFPARATFFFLVIGLQFFLYDFVKSWLQVGSDDLSLVLDVFYAVRAGLIGESL